jgi:hypothetical protein
MWIGAGYDGNALELPRDRSFDFLPRLRETLAIGIYGDHEQVRHDEASRSRVDLFLVEPQLFQGSGMPAPCRANSQCDFSARLASKASHEMLQELLVRAVLCEEIEPEDFSHREARAAAGLRGGLRPPPPQ